MREPVHDEDDADILPGVMVHGMDIGQWLQKQRQHALWAGPLDR
ncbi:hypothetical protein ACFVZR_37700 [Streptomyces sp. NPDC058316]